MVASTPLFSRYSHAYLLGSLLLLVGAQPFFQADAYGTTLFRVLLFASLGSAAFSCAASRRQLIGFAACFVPTLLTGIVWWATDAIWIQRVYFGLSMICTVYIVTLILGQTFRSRHVSANTIYGALSIYLLMGVMWAYLYMVLESMTPDASFDFGTRDFDKQDNVALFRHLLGFSYTTLTTLGYGNITPTTPKADALTTLEAMTGQMYVAILVARLVGIQVSQSVLRQASSEAGQAAPK